MMQRYSSESWFGLGDGDLATRLLRTQRLRSGLNLTEVTFELKAALDITAALLPMSDQPVRTLVQTDKGVLPFQRYLVQRRCGATAVRGLEFDGIKPQAPGHRRRCWPRWIAPLRWCSAPATPASVWTRSCCCPAWPSGCGPLPGRWWPSRPSSAARPSRGGHQDHGRAGRGGVGAGGGAGAVAGHIRLDGFVLDSGDSAAWPTPWLRWASRRG